MSEQKAVITKIYCFITAEREMSSDGEKNYPWIYIICPDYLFHFNFISGTYQQSMYGLHNIFQRHSDHAR